MQVDYDDICSLICSIFGGMKHIQNDRRVISLLINVAAKVFENEVEEAAKPKPPRVIEYSL
jgi:hypothetical protein